MTTPRLSFCTTCMGRLHHLRLTYLQNLTWALQVPSVEFVLLDYNSRDGLEDWAKARLGDYIKTGRVTYFKTCRPPRFECSRSKNMTVQLARGEYVCNLDADNFLGKGFVEHLMDLVSPRKVITASATGGGTFGRITVNKHKFESIGGYDESMVGYGWEDRDLIARLLKVGLRLAKFEALYDGICLDHSDTERTKLSPGKVDIRHASLENETRSAANIAAGKLVANAGVAWGCDTVTKNFSEVIKMTHAT